MPLGRGILAGQSIRMPAGENLPLKAFEETIDELRRGVRPEAAVQHLPHGYETEGHKTRTVLGLYFPMREARRHAHDASICEYV